MAFPGHLRAKGYTPEAAFFLLIHVYDGFEPFVLECYKLRPKLEELSERLHLRVGSQYGFQRERELIAALATQWNLDRIPQIREFNYRRLRIAVLQTGKQYGSYIATPFSGVGTARFVPEQPTVEHQGRVWEWALDSGEALGELVARVAGDLRLRRRQELPEEVQEQLSQLPDAARALNWELGDMLHGLKEHIRWLFLRLCPQPDVPWGYAKIAFEISENKTLPEVDKRMVRRTVMRLADSMKIDLPPLKPGRPRKR